MYGKIREHLQNELSGIRIADAAELDDLLSADQYEAMISE